MYQDRLTPQACGEKQGTFLCIETPGKLPPGPGAWAQPGLADRPLSDLSPDATNKAGQVFRGWGGCQEGILLPTQHFGYHLPSGDPRFLGSKNPKNQDTLSRPVVFQLGQRRCPEVDI